MHEGDASGESERTGDLDAWRRARRRLLSRGVRGAMAMGLTGLGATSWAHDAAAPIVDVPAGASLQSAIDRAEPGAVIRVGAGTFTETVVIEKPLTLLGAGYGRTVLSADRGAFRWSGLPRERYVVGALNVRDTRDVNIVGFTLRDALEGVWISASRNVRIRDCMSCEHDSSGYYLWASQDCIVEHCEGSTSAVGIYQGNSVDITIQRNLFRHNHGGRVPHLDNDHYPGIGILMGNVSLGCMVIGNALVDNVDWGVGVSLGVRDVRLLANEIRRNDVGVFAGERNVRMHGNAVTDNVTLGVDGAGTEVDARHNWWGAEDGPGGVGPGGGDAVTDGVRYRPWRATPAPVPSHGPREDPPDP